MRSEPHHDLDGGEQPVGKRIKLALKRKRKTAPEPETLRAWAKSSIKSRNKS